MPVALLTPLNNPAKIQALNKRLSVLVNVLLILAIAGLLSKVSWLFLPHNNPARMITPRTEPVANLQAQQNFRQLTASHIFGLSTIAPSSTQTRAPETKLNLILKGVLAAQPMKRASAIIAQGSTGKESIYGIGDSIKNGVTIKEIQANYVVLDRRGRLETLKFQHQRGLHSVSFSRAATGNLNTLGASTPGQVLAKIRRDILKSPMSFGDYALPIVVRANGRQIGYRLQPQAKGQLLTKLGLQPSDIITRINGISLNRPQNAIAALRKLSTAGQLRLMIRRNGSEMPLNIQLR